MAFLGLGNALSRIPGFRVLYGVGTFATGACTIVQRKFLRVKRGCQASQKKGLTSGEVRELPGKFGELPGKFGKLPGNLWKLLLSSTVRELPGKSPKNFRGSSGELPGKSGDFPEAWGSLTPFQRLAKFISKLCTKSDHFWRIFFLFFPFPPPPSFLKASSSWDLKTPRFLRGTQLSGAGVRRGVRKRHHYRKESLKKWCAKIGQKYYK